MAALPEPPSFPGSRRSAPPIRPATPLQPVHHFRRPSSFLHSSPHITLPASRSSTPTPPSRSPSCSPSDLSSSDHDHPAVEERARLRVTAGHDGRGRGRGEEKEEHIAYSYDEDHDDKYHKPSPPLQQQQPSDHSAVQIISPRGAFNRSGPLAATNIVSSASARPSSSRSSIFPSCILIVMLVAGTVMLGAWLGFLLRMPLNELQPRQLFRSHFPSNPLPVRLPPIQPTHPPPATLNTPTPSSAPPTLPVYSAHNLTFFTVYQPEAGLFERFTSLSTEKLVPVEHEPFVHHLYALSRLVPHAHHLVVYVRSIDDCALLEALPVDHVCRVTSCFTAVQTAEGAEVVHYPQLRCLLSDARDKSSTPLLAFVDDHTLLFPDFLAALFRVASQLPSFVLAGSSVSVTLRREGIDAKAWHDDLASSLVELTAGGATTSERQQPHYFAFPRSLQLSLHSLNGTVVMGRSGQAEHSWERHLLAHLLLSDVQVVDGSRAITAADMRHADQSNRTVEFNEWNDMQEGSSVNLTTAVGVLSSSHYILAGKCPTCSLKENHETDFALLLHRQATAERQIILLATNSDYLPLAFNWLCRAHALHMYNYILIAEDRFSFRVLRYLSLPAVLSPDAPYKQPSPSTSPVAHHRRLYLRALYMQQAVAHGYHTVSLSLDTLLLTSPFAHLPAAGQCDTHVYYHDRRVSTALLSVLPTVVGRRFLNELWTCEADNYNFTAAHGQNRFYFSDEADNNCGHFLMKRLVKRSGLRRCELKGQQWLEQPDLVVQTAQRAGQWPVIVHSDGGVAQVESWVRGWRGWKVDDRAMMDAVLGGGRDMQLQCRSVVPPTFVAPRFDDRHSFRLSVHILVSSAPSALSITLESLAAAVYDRSIPVSLHITVQQPPHQSLSDTQQLVEASRLAEAFDWQWGDKTVRWSEKHLGETMEWMDGWRHSADGEDADDEREAGLEDAADEAFYLGLRAGQAVSEQWFVWLRRALLSYYFDPFQFDPQLLGIHLLHQFAIVGETPAARYGSRIPSSVLNGTLLYHYQFVPLMGTVFFPNHMSAFYRWYASQPVSNSTACLPTLISNQWLQSDPVSHWHLHLTRFAFEHGWYVLYTNFASLADRRPRAVVVDQQDASGRTVEIVHRLRGAGEELMLPVELLPLYDVHFQRVTDNRTLLYVRKEVFPAEVSVVLGGVGDGGQRRQGGNVTRLVIDALHILLSSASDDLFAPTVTELAPVDSEVLSLSSQLTSQLSLLPPLPPANSTYDRCFVLDDDDMAVSLPTSSAAPVDITASLPFPYNQSLTVPELYAHIYETVTHALPKSPSPIKHPSSAQFLIYRPRLLLPFDRHLRGLYFAFLSALLTGRVLLVDWPDLESMYDCPFPGMKWSYAAFAPYLQTSNTVSTRIDEMEHRRLVNELRTASLASMYRQPVLVYGEAVAYDRLLFTNADYKPYALSLFGTASRMRRTGLLMRLLLSKPKGALVQQVKAVQQQLRLGTARYSVCVHLVAGDRRRVTGDESALPLPSEHWSCMQSQLHHLGFSSSDVKLVLTTDSTDEHSVAVADARLGQYGTIAVNTDVFANSSQYGVGNATVRASRQRDPLTGALLYDPYLLGLYQLSECDVSISSGSTFGIFGAARSGFSKRAYVYKAAPPPTKGAVDGKAGSSEEKDYCGPMHRIDMPKENDINF